MDLFIYPQVLLGWGGWVVLGYNQEVNPCLPNPKNFQGKPKIGTFQAVNTGVQLIPCMEILGKPPSEWLKIP